jgi:hypothetical protein
MTIHPSTLLRRFVTVCTLAWLGMAQAAEIPITFNVPVQVSRMPQAVRSVMVWCYLGSNDGTPQGRGFAPLNESGAYSGTVTVVARIPLEAAWEMRDDSWRCRLVLDITDPDFPLPDGSRGPMALVTAAHVHNAPGCSGYGTPCAAEGTAYTLQVSGRLTQQGGGQ